MNYQHHYETLITRARNRVMSGYTEAHHIIPRCMGGNDECANIVHLTAEEHYLAHLLLIKIYPSVRGLIVSAMFLTSKSQNRKSNNKIYGWLKKRFSERMSGNNHPLNQNAEFRKANQLYMRSENNPQKKNPRCGAKHHFYGKKNPFEFSKDAREKISKSKKGKLNPYFDLWGWRHPTCVNESLKIWKRADEVYDLYKKNPKYGYSRISKILDLDTSYRCAGVLNKIKEGWNPNEDIEWQKFKEREL